MELKDARKPTPPSFAMSLPSLRAVNGSLALRIIMNGHELAMNQGAPSEVSRWFRFRCVCNFPELAGSASNWNFLKNLNHPTYNLDGVCAC